MDQARTPLRLTPLLFIVLVVGTVLALSVAVHRDEGNPILYRGDGAIFRSNQNGSIVALFWEDGFYRNYGHIEDVRRSSDIGGELVPCNADVTSCVALGGDTPLMRPPLGERAWGFGAYDLQIVSEDNKGVVVAVLRDGRESYSYAYSPECGVRWINFSTGLERGHEVFYPVGRSLFSSPECPSGEQAVQGWGS